MKHSILAVWSLAALAILLPGGTMSAEAQAADTNAVFVGGTPIMRVRVASGGYSPAQRASQIQERVNKLLGQGPISPNDITAQPIRNEAVVMVKGQLLFTADLATARFNRASPMQLASMWAEHMRQVLPGLTQPK